MSNTFKKFMAALTSLFMALALVPATALAENAGTPQNPGKITVTSPADVPDGVTNTYTIYKIFDATVASDGTTAYKLPSGITTAPTGFTAASDTGYITAAPESLDATAIAAIKSYIDTNKIASSGTITTTGANDTKSSEDLQPGYYYVTTTTGTAVIVNANQTTTIKDKNELSTVDKVAGTEYDQGSKDAIAAVGTNQSFVAHITKKHGAGHIVFNDTMTNMTYNGDVTVTVNGTDVDTANYTATAATDNAGLTVTFTDSYIQGLADNTVIELKYSAKITSDALQNDPATNSASLTLDNKNTTKSEDVKVYNGKLTVTKTDGDGKALTGAGFKLKNSEGKYYTVTGEGTSKVVSWTDNGTEVMANTGDDSNVAVFSGLPAGTYTLGETTVPAGYNKASDSTVTVSLAKNNDGAFTNLDLSSTVKNVKGTSLPSTGGTGTVAFTVVGAGLVVTAGVLLVTRRRMQQ